jgi:hypothetical protein
MDNEGIYQSETLPYETVVDKLTDADTSVRRSVGHTPEAMSCSYAQ